jgi:hypothetical protein
LEIPKWYLLHNAALWTGFKKIAEENWLYKMSQKFVERVDIDSIMSW